MASKICMMIFNNAQRHSAYEMCVRCKVICIKKTIGSKLHYRPVLYTCNLEIDKIVVSGFMTVYTYGITSYTNFTGTVLMTIALYHPINMSNNFHMSFHSFVHVT